MRNSSLKKIVCWVLVCLMIQPTFGQEASMMLYYKSGINNVSFKYNNSHDSLSPLTVTTEEYPDGTLINVNENNMGSGKGTDLSIYASDYVSNLKLFNHIVGLDTKYATPNQLSFWINGSLSINGHEVAKVLSLGMLSGYWWYGSQYGERYVGTNDVTDKGLDLGDTSGNRYCLKEPSSNPNELFVYNSSCIDAGGNYAASSGKEKQQTFSFGYGAGITSISFDPSNNVSEDGSGHQLSADSIQLDNQGTQTRVLVTAGETGSLGTANAFNQLLGYSSNNEDMSHLLQLMPATEAAAHKPSAANNQNFWLSGKLKINGQVVKGNIVLGHNSDSSGNWWIGNSSGTRFDSGSNSGINVVGETDGQSYCINDSTTNNQAVVTAGACTDYSPTQGNIKSQSITFSYGTKNITAVTFTPKLTSNNESYVSEDGMGNPLPYGIIAYGSSNWYHNNVITVSNVGANGSAGTAADFNSLLGSDANSQMLHSLEVMDRRQNSAHQLTLAQNMNFWVKGTLRINGTIVSDNFIIGHNGTSDRNWWVGSPDGTRYDSGSNSGMNMQYVDVHNQTHYYCLNQSKLNYSLTVSDGECTPKTYPDKRYQNDWAWVAPAIGVTVALIDLGVCAATEGEWCILPTSRLARKAVATTTETELIPTETKSLHIQQSEEGVAPGEGEKGKEEEGEGARGGGGGEEDPLKATEAKSTKVKYRLRPWATYVRDSICCPTCGGEDYEVVQ